MDPLPGWFSTVLRQQGLEPRVLANRVQERVEAQLMNADQGRPCQQPIELDAGSLGIADLREDQSTTFGIPRAEKGVFAIDDGLL